MELTDKIKEYIDSGVRARSLLNKNEILTAARKFYNAIKTGHKLVTFGNGGSAADAQHIAAELTGRFLVERKSLPAIALTTNTSALTAIGNDYSYDDIFSRQVDGLVNKGDFVIGITTSGNSKNVINAIVRAKEKGAYTLALTGKSGGKVSDFANFTIKVNSDRTPIIQEVHIAIGHMLCMLLDDFIQEKGHNTEK